jgi:hypothetical protein
VYEQLRAKLGSAHNSHCADIPAAADVSALPSGYRFVSQGSNRLDFGLPEAFSTNCAHLEGLCVAGTMVALAE